MTKLTSPIEFRAWPKIPRLNRDMIVTEKIDGTNACVIVTEDGRVAAQSRKRIITPEADNFGFAAWVEANADGLRDGLGVGYHYGEWYGRGIQRGYGLEERRFALFNPDRYEELPEIDALEFVPVLARRTFDQLAVKRIVSDLHFEGSRAVPGWLQPEGVVVWHSAARQTFKVLIEGDEIPKGVAA